MTTEIIYRPATPEDIDLTYRIKTRSIKPYVRDIYGWDEDFQISFHRKTFNPANTRILLLKNLMPDMSLPQAMPERDAIFGYIEVEYRKAEIFLANILIDEDFQGRGLGMTIMHELIREAETAGERDKTDGGGGRPLRLEVFRINRRARTFYERLGFRVTGRDKIKYIMERR